MKHRILIGTLATFVHLLTISGDRAYAQSIRDQYNQEIRDAENERAQKRDFLLTPLRDAEKCYVISGLVDKSPYSPYICRKKSDSRLMVLYGPGPPAGYYPRKIRGVTYPAIRIIGSLYGDKGYAFESISTSPYYCIGEIKKCGYRTESNLRVANANTFYIQWRTNFTRFSEMETSPLYECHFDEMKCYTKDDPGYVIRDLSPISLKSIITKYE